jgi:hypothetical protein
MLTSTVLRSVGTNLLLRLGNRLWLTNASGQVVVVKP